MKRTLVMAVLTMSMATAAPAFASTGASSDFSVVFYSERHDNQDIYLIRAGEKVPVRLTNHPARDNCPAPSPDGKRIAFLSDRSGNFDIFLMNTDGSGLQQLTSTPAVELHPQFGPDGERIIFVRDYGEKTEIWTMRSDGTDQQRLTSGNWRDVRPSYSPDGRRIVFMSNRGGNFDIFTMAADGSNQTRITNTPWHEIFPTWSPNGKELAYTRKFPAEGPMRGMICIIDADGSNDRPLTAIETYDENPVWSPDGRFVLFQSVRDGNYEVYRMRRDGTDPLRLTFDPAWDGWASFVTVPPVSPAAPPPLRATVPFSLDHNRMLVDIELVRPDGSSRRARAWVDTGSSSLSLAEPLARELGLDLSALARDGSGHSVELAAAAPPARLGGLPLDLEGVAVRAHPGPLVRPGVPAEAMLPAGALRHDHVVFDYPAGELTIARPGALEPRGVPIPCRVNDATGLFMIEATIDGERVALGIDVGSAGTWVSNTLTEAWRKRHPDWPWAVGAVGSANFFGFPFELDGVLMQLPELGLGSLGARNVAVLGLGQKFFDWYSTKSAAPVVGFLGANVLRGFRVEVDFPGRTTYWEPGPATGVNDLDIVGLTLRAEDDGRITVAGVATRSGRRTVEGVEPGATLRRVGDLEVAKANLGAVIDALRGRPGEARLLVLEQGGKELTVEAPVTRFP